MKPPEGLFEGLLADGSAPVVMEEVRRGTGCVMTVHDVRQECTDFT